jgi:hypothetical protein
MQRDPRMEGFTTLGVKAELRAFVKANGPSCIVHRREDDDYWKEKHPEDPWWYKVVIESSGLPEGVFVKLRLVDPDEEHDPWVTIVGCHK